MRHYFIGVFFTVQMLVVGIGVTTVKPLSSFQIQQQE